MLVALLISSLDKLKGFEMIKDWSSMEVTIEDKVFQLFCDPNTPLEKVINALDYMKNKINELIIYHQSKQTDYEEMHG